MGLQAGEKSFNAQMRGQKGSEYEGGHRVPFFLSWPAGGLNKARDINTTHGTYRYLTNVHRFMWIEGSHGLFLRRTFFGASPI
jgi:hypothetical protein